MLIFTAREDFVCLGFFVLVENFSLIYEDVTIAVEGLQILTFARHSWPLSGKGSLACHTYCDTRHPFIMIISEDPCNTHPLPSVKQRSGHYLFLPLRSVAARIRTPNLPIARRRPSPTAPPPRYCT